MHYTHLLKLRVDCNSRREDIHLAKQTTCKQNNSPAIVLRVYVMCRQDKRKRAMWLFQCKHTNYMYMLTKQQHITHLLQLRMVIFDTPIQIIHTCILWLPPLPFLLILLLVNNFDEKWTIGLAQWQVCYLDSTFQPPLPSCQVKACSQMKANCLQELNTWF